MSHGPVPGMLTRAQLGELIERGEIETVLTVFPDMYGRLMGKRITGHYFMDHVLDDGMHACDYLLACDMEMDVIPGYKYTSWETGYGDFHCVPDLATLRYAAWLPRTAIVLCDLYTQNDEVVEVAPRRMLQRQIERAREMGLVAKGGSEIELYLFNETFASAKAKNYHDLQPIGDYNEDYHILQGTKEDDLVGAIRRHLDNSGVPIEFSKGEAGLGQQEINLQFCDALNQCDRNILYKHAAKEIAYQQNKAITFMAKWDERHTGSSCHIHLSLWNADDDSPAFDGETPLVGAVKSSDTFRWFLGGWMQRARELSACYAPYVASYKRYQSRSWAPTGIAWSYDNRTSGFRVVGKGKSLRVECRLPGADANPYIAYAAALAAGLDGIANKVEPPAVFQGDVYAAQNLPRVPTTLYEAIGEFERSDFAREAFGADVAEHYLHFIRTEQRKFDEVVTSWERARFFERA